MLFSAWGQNGVADTLVGGVDPPTFANGTRYDPDSKLIWLFDAKDWDEAKKIYEALQGWSDEIMTQICPKCGERKFIWSIQDEGTVWDCLGCGYKVKEDEEAEADCEFCGAKKMSSLLTDDEHQYRFCFSCGRESNANI